VEPASGTSPRVHEGQLETGGLARVDQIAVQQHRGADADRGPVDRGHDRLGSRADRPQEPEPRTVIADPGGIHEVSQIVAAAEDGRLAVNEHHAHVRRAGRALERVSDLGVHGERERIHLLRTADLDAGNAVGDFGEDVPAHRCPAR
jgi:hypothetical protein